MYVCDHLVETDDSLEEMLGLIHTDVRMTKRLSMQFGYVTMKALYDTAFLKKIQRFAFMNSIIQKRIKGVMPARLRSIPVNAEWSLCKG